MARRNISNWNPRAIPDTDLKYELKLNSVPSPIKFVIDVLKGKVDAVKFMDKELKIHTEILFNAFNTWKDIQRIPDVITMQTFSKSLNKIAKSKLIRVNNMPKRGYEFEYDETIAAIQVFMKMLNADILNIE